jgi:hypothetical protein
MRDERTTVDDERALYGRMMDERTIIDDERTIIDDERTIIEEDGR